MGEPNVSRRYASFLVRCWTLADGKPRIRIEHIQSGEAARVATPRAALDWLGARLSGPEADGSVLEHAMRRVATPGWYPRPSELTEPDCSSRVPSSIPGDPCGIRTRDLYLERVASWAARRTGQIKGRGQASPKGFRS